MQAALTEVERVDLAVEIPPVRLRHAGVRGKNVDDVLLNNAGADQLHGRDADALLKALRRLWIVVPWDIAADVEPMPDRGNPGEDAPAAHQRTHQAEIVEVRAAV